VQLTENEIQLVQQIGFDVDVAATLRRAIPGPLLSYQSASRGVAGVAGGVADGEVAEAVINAVQPSLLDRGYRAFWTHLRRANGSKICDAVVVLHSTDHFAILDAARPSAESHGGPEIIREKLKTYEQLCSIEIVGAASDWVAVAFKSLPSDLCGFAEGIYLFCPDSCDLSSGIGTRNKYTKEVRAAARALCPEISDGFRQEHKAKYGAHFSNAGLPQDFYQTLLSDAEQSVRLLAWQLKAEMYFFFWWD
jgi:hypothetical protein